MKLRSPDERSDIRGAFHPLIAFPAYRFAHAEAQVIGDHGTAQVFLWSSARIGGVPAEKLVAERGGDFAGLRKQLEQDVRYANITIIEGNNASQFGIGIVSARIAEMVLRGERAVIPIGSHNRRYGVTLSLPSVVGRDGVREVLEPAMTAAESEALDKSAETLRAALRRVQQEAAWALPRLTLLLIPRSTREASASRRMGRACKRRHQRALPMVRDAPLRGAPHHEATFVAGKEAVSGVGWVERSETHRLSRKLRFSRWVTALRA